MSYLFIINPKSGQHKKRDFNAQIIAACKMRSLTYEIIESIDSDVIKAAIAKSSAEIIVAVGGDGTICTIAGLVLEAGKTLGVLPAGSGNGYARNLGIKLPFKLGLEQLFSSKVIQVDLGLANQHHYIGVAGTGFDSHVANCFDQHGERGSRVYFKLAMREYFKFSNQSYRLEIDDNEEKMDAFIIAVAKSSQFGNGASIAPLSDLQDEMLDLVILKKANVLASLILMIRLYTNSIHGSKQVIYKKVKKVKIKKTGSILYHLDGELFEAQDELSLELHPKKLSVLKPSGDH